MVSEFKCIDTDECKDNNGDCMMRCHNVYGSYSCSCIPGFELNEVCTVCICRILCLE